MPIELMKISHFTPTACIAAMIMRACCAMSPEAPLKAVELENRELDPARHICLFRTG